jgi:hypothetical protein
LPGKESIPLGLGDFDWKSALEEFLGTSITWRGLLAFGRGVLR